jgi:hypothetical protein
MKTFISRATLTTLVFTFGVILTFLSYNFPDAKSLVWILLAICLVYLSLGWYLFRSYFPEGETVLLFIMGYFYSGVFIGSVFAAARWPLAGTIIASSVFWACLQTGLLLILRKKMQQKTFTQFLIEALLMLVMSVLQVIAY